MSRENVEIVRQGLLAYEVDESAWLQLLDPQIEWTPFEEGGTSVGIQEARRIRREWLDSWDKHDIEVEEVVDAGSDVLVVMHLVGVGRASKVPVDVRVFVVFTVNDGRITRVFERTDRPTAF